MQSVRFALGLAAMLCSASDPPAQAQSGGTTPPFEWSATRKLSQHDFQGKMPDAATFQSRSWIRIEASWRCISGTLNTTVNAVFDPAKSWWLGSQWNPWEDVDGRRKWLQRSRADIENKRHIALSEAELLRHEQLHFDLAELTARRIRHQLAALADVCIRPDRDAHVESIVVALTSEFGREQVVYDEATAHGTKQPAQHQWEARVATALQERDPR